ncbi:MAG TPA: LOG family protein [Gemmatimonadales bacterium]|nr:LOG family protein [Gemmatimonadales bacterium]
MPMRRVAVFAGSAAPLSPTYADAATRIGRLLAENGITLLTEGVMTGLEAMLVESAREAGGAVALLPRDPVLVEKADGFLALPQGLLTFDELFQLWSWQSPADPEKPTGLLNVDGYFTALLKNESDAAVERFARETQRGMLIVDPDPESLLRAMADFRPPETRRLQSRDDR